jgi:hypothetical protein
MQEFHAVRAGYAQPISQRRNIGSQRSVAHRPDSGLAVFIRQINLFS